MATLRRASLALVRIRPASSSALLFNQRSQIRGFAEVPLSLIKELRAASGAPISDCKKALQAEEVNSDLRKAFQWLRKKGQATIVKSNRSANEGLVGVAVDGAAGVIIEVNSETDFVARNADFQNFVKGLAKSTLALGERGGKEKGKGERIDIDVPSLLQAKGPGGAPVAQELADLVAKIRENIVIKRASKISVPEGGIIASYVHNSLGPSLGTAASLVAISTDASSSSSAAREAIEQFGKRLAMHVVAAKPCYLSPSAVPESVLDYERNVIKSQAAGSGKPEKIIAKMTEGRLRKFLGETSLLEQPHMIEEGNPLVKEVASRVGKANKCQVEVNGFVRIKVGEAEDLSTAST